MALVKVCNVDELQSGQARKLEGARPVAVFRVGEEFFAIDDTCTHAQSSLSEGYIDDYIVECAFHGAKFCVRTGKVLSLPATQPVRTYPVKVDEGCVFVDVD